MGMEKIIYKCHKKNAKIIMRKDKTLDFTIKTMNLKSDATIYIDLEKFQIGNKIINMTDLQTIYLYSVCNGGSTFYFLIINSAKFGNGAILDVTGISNSDVKKIEELFDYFIFSDEVASPKLNSDRYVPILDGGGNNPNNKLEKYTEVEKFLTSEEIIENKTIVDMQLSNIKKLINNKNNKANEEILNIISNSLDNKVMRIDNDVYVLKTILPTKFYKKYRTKRKYKIYESRFLNPNYIDIWQEFTQMQHEKNRKDKWSAFKDNTILMFAGIIIILCIISLLINLLK